MNDFPRLPDYVPPYVPPQGSLSRPSAQSIRETVATPRELSLTLAGYNEIIPLLYGEDRIAGVWLVRSYTSGGNMRFAMAWCWGEIEGVQSVYINGQLVSPSHMTHRTGTPGQGIDSMLSNDLAGFADRYANCAYTVFNIPAGEYEGFPQTHQIEAVVRGRLCYDPRTSVTQWTENPALQMADWISAGGDISPGMTVYGLVEAANHCDEILGGIEIRCQTAITVVTGLTTSQMLDMFAAYAECLWSYRDDGVLIVPDGIVDSPVATLTESEMMNLRLLGAESLRSPTSVSITYRDPSGTGEQWNQETVTQMLPGVENGDIAEIPSDITLLGVHRSSEASRKALMRLRRLSSPGQYAWQAFDEGIRFERGDVVKLPDALGLSDALCRILSVEMASPGIYQITAEHYSDDMYPDDVEPGEKSNVPVGGILIFAGEGTPAGYQDFNDANDRYIVGAGNSFSPGSTGGNNILTGISGTTETDNPHRGNEPVRTSAYAGNFLINGVPNGRHPYSVTTNHDHDYTADDVDASPSGRKMRWIQKTGLPGGVPSGGCVLSDGQIVSVVFDHLNSYIGRLLMSGSSDANYGYSSRVTPASYGVNNQAWNHRHPSAQRSDDGPTDGPSFIGPIFGYVSAGPLHNHPGSSLRVTPDLRRIKLAIYKASSSAQIEIGSIIGFPGSQPLPPGWSKCDGTNGTPPIEDLHIEISRPGDAGGITGSGKAKVTARSGMGGYHNHRGSGYGTSSYYGQHSHGDDVGHDHNVDDELDYQPEYYAMQFIQYNGAE